MVNFNNSKYNQKGKKFNVITNCFKQSMLKNSVCHMIKFDPD